MITMTEKAILYYTPWSMPSRAALLGVRYFNIDIDLKNVDLTKKEQHQEYFKKINPIGKVPVFVDSDGFILSESRAILAYLVNTRSPESDLYPNDPKKRALIDQRLYYDATVVFPTVRAIVRPIMYNIVNFVDPKLVEEANDVFKMLETFLSNSEYFAGDQMTIADISILSNITTFAELGFSFVNYPKVSAWYSKMKKIPGFEENRDGARFLAETLTQKIGKSLF